MLSLGVKSPLYLGSPAAPSSALRDSLHICFAPYIAKARVIRVHCRKSHPQRIQSTQVTMAAAAESPRVVIVGAGVIGTSIAYYLSLRGVAATVIERASVACAASGKAGGFLAVDWCDGSPVGDLARLSYQLHRDLPSDLEDDIGYRVVCTIGGNIGKPGKQRRPEGSNYDPAWLDGPVSRLQVMGTEATTAQVHPGKLTQGFMKAAQRRGASLCIGTVTGLDISHNDQACVEGVMVDGERVAADVVVLAMGPWTSHAAKWLPVPQVFGQLGNSMILKSHQPLSAHALYLHGASGEVDIFCRPDGTAYVCGENDIINTPEDPLDVQPDPAAIKRLKRNAGLVSSALAEAEVEAEQACLRPTSYSGMPIIGALPGASGAFIATGHSCWGILNAPATGKAMAELILDGQATCVNLSPFDPARLLPLQHRKPKVRG
ncbi:hypothetical protein WJX74_003287 [Apatococcus lobatus]|uniref:FAD dependent oxidoreductase domain-containing protein n=2 Tax=Apatococcus TaxID=904362 RepID=A0AAW1SYL9_9CHLO